MNNQVVDEEFCMCRRTAWRDTSGTATNKLGISKDYKYGKVGIGGQSL